MIVCCASFNRWGATLIAYRKDRLLRRGGHPILDWSDLLQPQLQGRVAVTASSRELLGLALKTLGVGYNPRWAWIVFCLLLLCISLYEQSGHAMRCSYLPVSSLVKLPCPFIGLDHRLLIATRSVAELEAAGVTEEVLAQRLHLIRKQVKLFNSNDHVRALQAGEVGGEGALVCILCNIALQGMVYCLRRLFFSHDSHYACVVFDLCR